MTKPACLGMVLSPKPFAANTAEGRRQKRIWRRVRDCLGSGLLVPLFSIFI